MIGSKQRRGSKSIIPCGAALPPQAQVDQYDEHQKEAFLKAFNNAYEEYGHDESRAFAVAHHAAKQARRKEAAPHH